MSHLALLLEEQQFQTWQNFLIANLAGLFLVVFWAGILTSRITQLREKDRDNIQAHKELQHLISHHSQVVPVAELTVKLDGIGDKLDGLKTEFDELRKSIFGTYIHEYSEA